MLLEDLIRFCLPSIFSFFGYDVFSSHIIKVTRDAEIDIDYDVTTSLMEKIEKGLRNRKKGKPVRFVFDREIDPALLTYLVKRLGLSEKDNLIPGGRIHNFKDFIGFPESVFSQKSTRKKPFLHPLLKNVNSVSDVVMKRDVLLTFPYHSFDTVTDLLREAAIDPEVTSIKLTCYRLAPRSKIINALTNAVRNGKQVTVVIELRARFDEEANLEWKQVLEETGAKVLLGVPNMKVHSKLCLIKKVVNNRTIHYGFVSTGNLNERTALIYGDHCLLTSDRNIMADVNRIFHYLALPRLGEVLKCTILAKYEKVPADKLVGTILVERVVDLLSLLIVFIIAIATQLDIIGVYAGKTLKKNFLSGGVELVLVKLLAVIAMLVLGYFFLKYIFKTYRHVGFIKKLNNLFNGVGAGLASIRKLENKKAFLLHSVLIWVGYAAGTYLGFFVIEATEHLPLAAVFPVLVFASIGMIVTPGGIGTYQLFIMEVMLLYGIDKGPGYANGILQWLAQFVIVLLVGFVSLVALPYYNRKAIARKSLKETEA